MPIGTSVRVFPGIRQDTEKKDNRFFIYPFVANTAGVGNVRDDLPIILDNIPATSGRGYRGTIDLFHRDCMRIYKQNVFKDILRKKSHILMAKNKFI